MGTPTQQARGQQWWPPTLPVANQTVGWLVHPPSRPRRRQAQVPHAAQHSPRRQHATAQSTSSPSPERQQAQVPHAPHTACTSVPPGGTASPEARPRGRGRHAPVGDPLPAGAVAALSPVG